MVQRDVNNFVRELESSMHSQHSLVKHTDQTYTSLTHIIVQSNNMTTHCLHTVYYNQIELQQ